MLRLRGQDLQKGEVISYTEYTLGLVYQPKNRMSRLTPQSVETASNENTDTAEGWKSINGK